MADVKFSELTTLAAADVASGDILAVVDTSASTSKKLSIDNLFGAVPVNIAVDDATDTSGGTTGSIQTDGGIGAAKAIYAGTTLTVGTDATIGDDLSFSSDAAVVSFGADSEVTLTHVHNTGLLLTDDSGVGTTQLQFGDAGTYIHQSADGVLDIVSDGTLNATVGAAGMVLKGTTPKLTIGDAGAEDTFLIFDGNAQDYRIGLDDGTDILEMGVGAAHGTTPSLKLEADLNVDVAGHNGTVGLKLGGTVVGSTAAELNMLDGSAKSTSSITIADADAFIVIDGNTTKQIPASDLETYLESSLDTLSSVTSVGTLTGLTVSGAIVPNASGTVDIGSASAEINDIFFSTGSVLNFADGQEVTLTAATTGLTINGTKKIMFGDSASFVHQSADGVLTIDGEATVDINASTALLVSNDLKLDSDASVLGFGVNNDVTLTHVHDTGLLLNSTMQLQFNDASQYISGTSATVLSIAATDEIDLTATAIDINGTVDISGLAVLSANTTIGAGAAGVDYTLTFNGADNDGVITWAEDEDYFTFSDDVLMSTTEKVQFHDTGQYVYAPADARLAVVSDGDIELTATDIKVGLASQDANIQALTDAFDMTLKQYDGVECARIFDGGKALTDTDAATRKGGFGFRRPVIDIDASGANKAVALTDAESGALIKINNSSGSYAAAVTLPAVGADSEGVFYDFIVEANNASAFTIQTAASDSNIYAYGITVATAGSDVAGGDVLTIAANATKGTKLRLTAAVGHGTTSNILWIAEYSQPAGTAPAVA